MHESDNDRERETSPAAGVEDKNQGHSVCSQGQGLSACVQSGPQCLQSGPQCLQSGPSLSGKIGRGDDKAFAQGVLFPNLMQYASCFILAHISLREVCNMRHASLKVDNPSMSCLKSSCAIRFEMTASQGMTRKLECIKDLGVRADAHIWSRMALAVHHKIGSHNALLNVCTGR
eukprot:scaffold79375_cov19-Tisochrysis_lutea.AAC.1